MMLRDCNTSHFIWSIKDGGVKQVHNMDIHGRPSLRFKKLEDVNRAADTENALKLQNDYCGAELNSNRAKAESTCIPFADRITKSRDGYSIEDEKPECLSNDINEEMTLRQLKKKCKTKKRKASESVLGTPESGDDDFDLSEPLCNWTVKVSKSLKSKRIHAKESCQSSSTSTIYIKSEPFTEAGDASLVSKDSFSTVTGASDTAEVETSECREFTYVFDESLICDKPVGYTALGLSSGTVNHQLKCKESRSTTYERENCSANEDSLDDKTASLHGGKSMELDSEEHMAKQPSVFTRSEFNEEESINHPSPIVSSIEAGSPVTDKTENTNDCTQSHHCSERIADQTLQLTGVQDSDSTNENDHFCVEPGLVSESHMNEDYTEGSPQSQEYVCPPRLPSYLCLPWKSHSWSIPDHDVVSLDANSPSTDEKQPLASMNVDTDMYSLNSDNRTLVLEDTSSHEEKLPFVPVTADSEVNFADHDNQNDFASEASGMKDYHCIEPRKHLVRLPLTRTAISPSSQEKLCLAMNSAELSDNMEHLECKNKLCFREQSESKFSPNGSNDEDNGPNVHPPQATHFIPDKVSSFPKQILKKPKNNKKDCPPKKCSLSKGNLDGPRLCRSLPCLSTGSNSVQACSERAIAFSQRQMHDIESLALKLMTELKSMKAIVEEKLLFEAYRTTSLRNEADEVKSAIKTATKTEETARKWLSMMSRDCNRFCKIMKFTEDDNTSGIKNSLQKERKKISFADEAGGALCDVRFFDDDTPSPSQESTEEK